MSGQSPYYSPSQVLLFVNGYYIDDAAAVSWNISDEKVPIYGYADQDFRTVVPGRSIVHGQLEIHFRYWGYLTNVITAAQGRTAASVEEVARQLRTIQHHKNSQPLQELYRDYAGEDAVEKRTQVARDVFVQRLRDRGGFIGPPSQTAEEQLDKLSEAFWSRENRLQYNQAERREEAANMTRPGRISSALEGLREGFGIVVRFGSLSDQQDPSTTLLIRGVRILGQSTAISSEVPEAGAPVREAYSFLARSIGPFKVP